MTKETFIDIWLIIAKMVFKAISIILGVVFLGLVPFLWFIENYNTAEPILVIATSIYLILIGITAFSIIIYFNEE